MKILSIAAMAVLMVSSCKEKGHDKSVDELITAKTEVHIPDSPAYHIQVLCFGNQKYLDEQYYCIHFTNDDWETYSEIMSTWDETFNGIDTVPKIVHQLWLGNENEAIKIARELKTYTACLNYNLRVSQKRDSLYLYRLAHPYPKPAKPEPVKQDTTCCKVVNVY